MNAPLPLAGFVPGLAFDAYRAVEAMSASGAKKMLRSPMHYKLDRSAPAEPTAAMQFGSAVHLGILEPARWSTDVLIAPDVDKRTKAGKEEWAAFKASAAGKVALSMSDYVRAEYCLNAVLDHPAARALLNGAEVEGSLFWRDRQYDVPCKARFDARNHGGLIDVKTCQDASAEGFARQAASLLYHVQGAHYTSGSEHVFNASPEFFAFICVESEPPHAVACYVLPGEAIRAGMHLMSIALERYRDALLNDHYPGYPQTIERLPFPKWALRFNA